jgi:glc operon protein GlcG
MATSPCRFEAPAMKRLIACLLLATPLLAKAHAESPGLSLSTAMRMADAAQAAATTAGYKVVISLHDQHGNLKYLRRMDGSAVGSIQVAQLKAATSASFPLSSAALAERSASRPGNPYAGIPGLVLLEGGLPIFDLQRRHVGSIGISGATAALDEQFAEAALAAFADPQPG